MSKITVTTIAGLTSGGDANTVKIESGDAFNVVSGATTLGGDLTVDTSTLKVDSSNNRVGMGTASPSRQVMISRTIADGSGELGIVSSDSSTTGALGNIHFGNSTDTSLASIRATADGATDSAKLEFNTEKTGAAIETAMRIDSNGRVTKPLNPSFQAKGGDNNYVTTSPIPFPTVSGSGISAGAHNIGGHYNASNYTFTAPVAGRYIFHVHLGIVRGSQNGSQMYPTLLVNGSGVAYTYAKLEVAPSANHYLNCNLTQVVNLAANDAVKVNFNQSSGGSYYNGTSESSFMGYLLG